MNLFLMSVLLTCSLSLTNSQECRQVTVCDDDQATSRRGEKGYVGAPGKAGPVGMKGAKGEVGEIGEKGIQGESCALGSFESEMRQKLSKLETLLTPTSCLTSSTYGRQTLRSGKEAFCDNGWTMFHRNFGDVEDFARGWQDYKSGFGNLEENFWLGLDNIYNLTSDRGCKLRVDVWDSDNDHEFAVYSDFSIEDDSDNYRLHVKGYSGTAGDGLNEYSSATGIHNNREFTTRDTSESGGSCSSTYNNVGWWYGSCVDSNLNAPTSQRYWDSALRQRATMKLRCD